MPMEMASDFRQHWRTLAGCTIAASIGTFGLHSYTSGAFVPELAKHAGFTRGEMSLATLILCATIAVSAPFVGALMDRYGALRIVSVAVVGEAAAFALLGLIRANFPSYASGIFILAVLGVGTTPPGFARMVTARFDRSRVLALGVLISGLCVVAIAGPVWMTAVIQHLGWRGGYFALAGLVLLLGGGGVLLTRSDGTMPEAQGNTDESQSRARAGGYAPLRRPLFWMMLLGFAAPAVFCGGYILHLITLLRERGFSRGEAAQIQALIGVAVLAGRLGSGWALDHFPAQRVAACTAFVSGLACALLLQSDPVLLCIAALGIGLTIGAELDVMAYLLSRYFGLDSFGRLYALAYACLITSAGVSPVLINWIADFGGGYGAALITSTIGTISGAAVLMLLPNPPVSAAWGTIAETSSRHRLADPVDPATVAET
ncbi:MFS transporter [Sphingobium sp. TB-6]|uniref:MFS transporter n=2 Tax=unclassified Sphingobium TaxID=2611147 RepID=UPI00146C287E|nr:MFS transporter [Sphingobium sp. TB-6]NML89695.1 MFS transporter [Sphingobium sp. TB-6]